MNLEDKINRLIEEDSLEASIEASKSFSIGEMPIGLDYEFFTPIEEWVWPGAEVIGNQENNGARVLFRGTNALVHRIIQGADLTECLTSPSEYVREYRKWYESRRENK